jgi:hypothetical protein
LLVRFVLGLEFFIFSQIKKKRKKKNLGRISNKIFVERVLSNLRLQLSSNAGGFFSSISAL